MKWRRAWCREYSVQYCEIALHALGKKVKHILPFYMEKQMIIPDNKHECMYYEKTEEKNFTEIIIKHFCENKQKFDLFVKLFYELGKDYVSIAKKINSMDLETLNNIKLKKLYLDYQKKAFDYGCVLSVTFLLNEYWTEYGNRILKTADDRVKEALFKPVKKSTVLIMQEKASKIKGNDEEIEKFWKEYKWLPCLDLQNKPWSLKDIKDYIDNLRLGKPYEELSFKKAVEKAELNREAIEKFQMIKELAYIKDVRDDFRRQGVFFIQKLFTEFGKRMDLELKEVAYLTEKEIIKFLEGEKIDLNKAKKKQEGFMMYIKDDEIICVDHNINDEIKKLGFTEEEEKITEIKGMPACKGKARGIVKIVRTVHDILKIKKGDILVAVTTHPDYVPAMQKAAAIVTDEGGMLSHAAIVSRELGIPCIVGTKKATKVLQHGTEVEVDAEKGIVKILKNSK